MAYRRTAAAAATSGRCLVSANRHLDHYTGWGVPVLPDQLPDHLPPYPGPLAGFLTGLTHCSTPWLLTVPCDSPFFPHDWPSGWPPVRTTITPDWYWPRPRMPPASCAPQPTFALLHRSLAPSLADFLQQGGHKIGQWAQEQGRILCPF